MNTLILAAALLVGGPGRLFDTDPPAPAVTELPPIATPRTSQPPSTSEAPATRADIEGLATKLHGILMPMEDRLHAVEQSSASMAAQLRELSVSHDQTIADLRASRAELAKVQAAQRTAPPQQAPAAPPATTPKLWTLDDHDRKAWVDTDRERLKRLVAEENRKIDARRAAEAPAVTYASYAAPPAVSYAPPVGMPYGAPGAFASMDMGYGGMMGASFMSGTPMMSGCPGGNCGTGFR